MSEIETGNSWESYFHVLEMERIAKRCAGRKQPSAHSRSLARPTLRFTIRNVNFASRENRPPKCIPTISGVTLRLISGVLNYSVFAQSKDYLYQVLWNIYHVRPVDINKYPAAQEKKRHDTVA